MNICEAYAALLDLYVDNELTPEEAQRVREHLLQCPACRSYVEDALLIRAAFPTVEDRAVPVDLAASVMAAVAAAPRQAPKRKPIRTRALGTFAAGLAACFALLLLVKGPSAHKLAAPQAAGGAAETVSVTEGGIEAYTAKSSDMLRLADTMDTAAEEADTVIITDSALAGQTAPDAHAEPELAQTFLQLTAEEAGDLLNAFQPVYEDSFEVHYELTAEEFHTLLDALPEAVHGLSRPYPPHGALVAVTR